ncbi:MAG TPA: DUF2721 domain-containing protein [Abditibacteriaceae bacterium]|jgi:hypothetical protein
MPETTRTASEIAQSFIGAAITPALLFTACALLLSGLQSKYSTLVGSIRVLGAERRTLETQHGEFAQARRDNLGQQIEALVGRARLVRNAVFCLYLGITGLLLASLCGGVAAVGVTAAAAGTLVFFAFGMSCVVAAMGFGFTEASRSFEVLRLEAMSGESTETAEDDE